MKRTLLAFRACLSVLFSMIVTSTFVASNVRFAAVGDALGAQYAASVTIVDNDLGVEFAVNALWFYEDEGGASFKVEAQKGVRLKVVRGNDGMLGPSEGFSSELKFPGRPVCFRKRFHRANFAISK